MRRITFVGFSGLVVAMVLGTFVGSAGFTFYYAEGASYLSNDPLACVNCHVMRDYYDSWQKSSHHAVATCNDCHIPHDFVGKWVTKAENGFWHSFYFTFQNFHEPIRIRPSNSAVLQQNCLDCHTEFVSPIIEHQFHDYDPRGCVRCHETVGHGPTR